MVIKWLSPISGRVGGDERLRGPISDQLRPVEGRRCRQRSPVGFPPALGTWANLGSKVTYWLQSSAVGPPRPAPVGQVKSWDRLPSSNPLPPDRQAGQLGWKVSHWGLWDQWSSVGQPRLSRSCFEGEELGRPNFYQLPPPAGRIAIQGEGAKIL